jgi:hypothetical protein
MMVPFVDRELPAERIWLYQPEVSERRPLAAAKLRNDHDSGLPAGIVTTYGTNADGSIDFAGDAVLPLLPKGASKLLTFALDSRTDIRREDGGEARSVLGKSVNGVLTRTIRLRRAISYEVTAPADEDREILVEEPRFEGWKASADSKGVEETPGHFRHKINAAKGKTAKATLLLEHLSSQTVVLTSLPAEQILASIQGLEGETPAIKGAIAKLAGIVADINRARSQLAKLDVERKQIAADQERIRRNLQSVGQSSDLGRQYIEMLKKQEDRLAEIARLEKSLEAEIAARRVLAGQVARQLTF